MFQPFLLTFSSSSHAYGSGCVKIPFVLEALRGYEPGTLVSAQQVASKMKALKLRTRDGYMDEIHALRTQVKADMVSLIADGHHWAAFKLDKIFFTVMSRKGQLLPLPQLHTIAHEIARQRGRGQSDRRQGRHQGGHRRPHGTHRGTGSGPWGCWD